MKQFSKVFKFEFLNIIRSKAFIFLTLLMFIGTTVTLFYPRLQGETKAPDIEYGTPHKLAICDFAGNTGKFLESGLSDYDITLCDSESKANELLSSNKVDAVIIMKTDLTYTYAVNNMSMYDTTPSAINELLQLKYRTEKLAQFGLTESQIAEIQTSVAVPEYKIVGQDQSQSFFYTYVLLFMLYVSVIAYGQMIAQSVGAEKSSRAMELLITSSKPESLIFGKVLGTGFAGLSQMMFILFWAVICYKINAPFWEGNALIASVFDMPLSLICYAAVFFVLGFLIYAFLYGALGSLASKMEDIGTLTTPLTFVMVAAFMIPLVSTSTGKVDTTLMKILSFIPFCSPMAMFARISMSTVSPVQIIISVAVLILSNIGIGYIAVLIYKTGILMYGNPPKITQVLKNIMR